MSTTLKIFAIILGVLLLNIKLIAQNKPIGQWRSHLPYNKAISIATNGNKIFVAGQSSFFTYNILEKEISTYAKENGMSDVEMTYIAHDPVTEITILAYTNSNIDLFKDETFYNIPDLKLKTVTSNKNINHIYIDNGLAYLSTGIGIIVLNLEKKEIKETYVFTQNNKNFIVRGLTSFGGFFYAVTDNGLYSISKSNPKIQASSSWKKLDSLRKYQYTTTVNNKVFIASEDSVFLVQSDTLSYFFSKLNHKIQHLDPTEKGIAISLYSSSLNKGNTILFNSLLQPIDSFNSDAPKQTIVTSDARLWVADENQGLITKDESITPNGPRDIGTYDIIANDGIVSIAHGSYDDKWNTRSNFNGVSVFKNNSWENFSSKTNTGLAKLVDAVRIAIDPDDNTLYIASQLEGLYFLKSNKTGGQIKDGVFEPHIIDPGTYRLSGVAFDSEKNLWVTQTNAPHELMARSKKDGNWYKFELPTTRPRPFWSNGAAGLIIDDYDQKWFFSPVGGGVLIYNDKGTLENTTDDTYIRLTSGKGFGNLPDNNVQCIVNDKKGTVWIGTNNGIGIINCPDRVTNFECEAEIRVVQYDNFAGELFSGENVKTIAVDGANRKWIGTGNGVWLISEDANKIINRFTVDNSPLPSNIIQTIKVDPSNGDVYFGTDKGLVSYRGTAIDGKEKNKDVIIFPNPVKADYRGPIAIKGLVENADVRITDISGQLIFKTKALGGQAIWNGTDYTGRRPQSGVFLVFVSNNLGTEKYAGKFVFIH
jgi:ligand-binding sensor domain-containing protein